MRYNARWAFCVHRRTKTSNLNDFAPLASSGSTILFIFCDEDIIELNLKGVSNILKNDCYTETLNH